MAQRLLRTSVLSMLAIGLLLGGVPAGTDAVHTDPQFSIMALLGSGPSQASAQPVLASTIAFVSSRDNPTATGAALFNAAEIYLMNPDGANPRRLTANTAGDGFPALSPDGKWIVFDSNRDRAAGEALNTSDLFVMKNDGKDQTHLTRGSSASWSPDSRKIAFHASASGTGLPIKNDPGAATSDSDLFVLNVGGCLDDLDSCQGVGEKKDITNSVNIIDDDPDWSPDGQKIVYTRHDADDDAQNSITAEIYVMRVNPDGTPVQDGTLNPQRLTTNGYEERGPVWSPDGARILFMCRIGANPNPVNPTPTFEICVMNADGTGEVVRRTTNTVPDLTPTWSPDGQQIAFHRPVSGRLQIIRMNATGAGETQLTHTAGNNGFANWGELRLVR